MFSCKKRKFETSFTIRNVSKAMKSSTKDDTCASIESTWRRGHSSAENNLEMNVRFGMNGAKNCTRVDSF